MSASLNDQTTAPKNNHWVLKSLAGLLLALAALFFLGPVNEFGPDTPTARQAPPTALADLDPWLQTSESKFEGLRPGTAKGVVWASADKQQTPWSVVYIHGFSATRLETAPLADQVAKALGANLFYTRLSGHGLPGQAMGEASAQDWMADTLEAVRIGKTLGRKVLVISCSTGSTLSTWLGTTPQAADVSAFVFISPNFGLKNKMSELINGHWGQQIATAISGDTIRYEQTDPREVVAWTGSYPTKALFPMMALVKKVRDSDLSAFQKPVLVLYSAADQTVDPEEIKATFARLGSQQKSIDAVTYSQSKGQHVLAGDIRDPQSVAPMAESIVNWTNSLAIP
ncbi:MAG: alpha/beta hydrolase [Betaproteobacteria bacterium]|nr:alpha/beta hydrolase [Betaproteobacteria bacterium]NDG16094.1 alpha/beta hydrolase [Betaproteobacteria bacterium]